MTKKTDPHDYTDDYVKKSTMLLVGLISLGAGFIGGVVFSAYKGAPRVSMPVAQQQQPAPEQRISAEQARQLLALEKAVAANPKDVDAWTRLGNVNFDTGNIEGAIKAYRKSLALNPDNANVQTDLGVMYRRNGQPEEAIKSFDEAYRIDPRHEVSRFNKGIVLLHDLNDQNGAMEAWEELVRINPAAMTPTGQPVSELIKRIRETTKK